MKVEGITPILNVSNIEESFAWFEKLGWEKRWDWGEPPEFGSVGSGKYEIFLCKDGQGSRGGPMPRFAGDDDTGGVWMSWWVSSPAEVDDIHSQALENGMTVTWPPTDEPWNVREFHLRHPDGHTFRVSAGLGEEEDE
jgi:catechol 2,3-dioxygenase-like lactoylglutathione lyase family enzyme